MKQIIFNIEKLYVDCIDKHGNCFIIYWVKAELFLIKFFYSGLVFCDAEGFTTEKSRLKKIKKPVINGSLNFNNKFLKTNVSLERTDDPIIRSLYKDSEKNELIWNCHHPKALTEIKYNGNFYKGFGYAETLVSPLKPWSLPIYELRWGRFLTDLYTLIWINWKGKYPVNKIFFNGVEYNDAIFENDNFVFCNGMYQLKFSEIQIIRKGNLSGLFSKMKLLRIFFNRRFMKTVEIKYKAKTTLNKNSVVLSNDWSLFEIVTWGKLK
ncbi:MAG: hypothetical protein LLG13_15035 [Bacteroidales bacterium]|nr:hypothetical protein [Bacteroidales bacterium]